VSGIYKVPFNATLTAPNDFVEITATSSQPLVLLAVALWQTSDVGDAAEEIVEVSFQTGNTTSGSGGSAVTPANTWTSGPAAGFAAESGNTTAATGGTATERARWGMNVRVPMVEKLTEAEQIGIAAGVRGVLRLISTPTDSLTFRGELTVQEIG
jgi:hypothetical protein